jgi:hypothetical protein
MTKAKKINRHNNSSGDLLRDQCHIYQCNSLIYMNIYLNNGGERGIRTLDTD